MGFLDERVSSNKEKVAEMEKIEKLILQMQNNVNVKINQQGDNRRIKKENRVNASPTGNIKRNIR